MVDSFMEISKQDIENVDNALKINSDYKLKNSKFNVKSFQKAKDIVDDLNRRHEEARKYQSLLLRANENGEVSGGLFENKKPLSQIVQYDK